VVVAGFNMNVVVVGVVVLALPRELTAEKVDTGRLTSVPPCPLATDNGSCMSSCCPWATMPLPEVVFTRRVPVELWVVILPGAREEMALGVEVINWRIGVCAETTEVPVTEEVMELGAMSAGVVRDWGVVTRKGERYRSSNQLAC